MPFLKIFFGAFGRLFLSRVSCVPCSVYMLIQMRHRDPELLTVIVWVLLNRLYGSLQLLSCFPEVPEDIFLVHNRKLPAALRLSSGSTARQGRGACSEWLVAHAVPLEHVVRGRFARTLALYYCRPPQGTVLPRSRRVGAANVGRVVGRTHPPPSTQRVQAPVSQEALPQDMPPTGAQFPDADQTDLHLHRKTHNRTRYGIRARPCADALTAPESLDHEAPD